MNYRRGLTRLYLVLWAFWVFGIVVLLPEHLQQELEHRSSVILEGSYATHSDDALRASSSDLAASLAKSAHRYDWGPWFVTLYENLGMTVLALIVFPAIVYGLLFAMGATAVWVLRGFLDTATS